MANVKTPTREPKQFRFVSVIETTLDGEALEMFRDTLVGEVSGQLEQFDAKHGEHVVSIIQDMDEVSDEESGILQEVHDRMIEGGGLEKDAGRAAARKR